MSSPSRPLVSICVSTIPGRSVLFGMTLASILKQTYSPLEVVVLANGSYADSMALLAGCQDPRVRWIATPVLCPMVAAWNRVCGETKGKYVLFCSDDDMLAGEAVDHQVALLEQNPGVGFCHADFTTIDDDGRQISSWISHRGQFIDNGVGAWRSFLIAPRCHILTTVFRRDLWLQVGGWDGDAGNPGDNSLYLKLLALSDVGHVAHIAGHYRVRVKQPDSWELRFRNTREYLAFGQKYLSHSPAGVDPFLPTLRRKLITRILMEGAELLAGAPDEACRGQVRAWLESSVWQSGRVGNIFRIVDGLGLSWTIPVVSKSMGQLRSRARQVLVGLAGVARSRG